MASDFAEPNHHFTMQVGIEKLRTHLPPFPPIRFTLIYGWEHKRWEVLTQFHPDNGPALLLGQEDLESFPSDTLIAQAVLVA